MENNTGFDLEVKFAVHVTAEDIDDILCTAFEGGICYWCDEVEVVGKYLGKYASEQISRGGKLVLHDAESSDKWELDLEKIKQGIEMYICLFPDKIEGDEINGYYIDTSNIDSDVADEIIQYALFGELMFA